MSSSNSDAELATPPSRAGSNVADNIEEPRATNQQETSETNSDKRTSPINLTKPAAGRDGHLSSDFDDYNNSTDEHQPPSTISSGSKGAVTAGEGPSSSDASSPVAGGSNSPLPKELPKQEPQSPPQQSKGTQSPSNLTFARETVPKSSSLQNLSSPGDERSEAEEVVTSFKCQKCSLPITLDAVVANIDEQSFIELTGLRKPFWGHRDALREQAQQEADNGNHDFYLVKSTNNGNESSSSPHHHHHGHGHGQNSPSSHLTDENYHRKLVVARLFDILTDQSDVKHPLCEDCAEKILNDMDGELKSLEDECADYKSKLDVLKTNLKGTEEDTLRETEELSTQAATLDQEEETLRQELAQLNLKAEEVERELEEQQAALKAQREDEDKYWREYNFLKHEMFDLDDELSSVDNEYRYLTAQLDKLKRTSALKSVFFIMPSGPFGTINGLRLGRLPPASPVEWSEINAAWGQTCLLLASLARKQDFEFAKYKLVPYGNFSRIETLDERPAKELPLHGSGGFRSLWAGGFDTGMVAFLDCLAQLAEDIERGDPSFALPYVINAAKGRIEDIKNKKEYSVKLFNNSDENWTKALKYMLTNMKWMLEWVSSWER